VTATADQLAPIIGHRAVVTYTGSPTGPRAVTGTLTWERPDELTGSAMLFLDPEGEGEGFLYLSPADILAVTDLDMGGVVYDYGQPASPRDDQSPLDLIRRLRVTADQHRKIDASLAIHAADALERLCRRIQALATELDERLEDEDRDSGLILDELPQRLRSLAGGS